MATSSIPSAIDYLVTTIGALSAFADPVVVADGWPAERGDRGITIGISPEDDTTENDQIHAELGAQSEWEQYAIPCLIWSRAAGGVAMKTARDAAFVLLDAIDTHMRTTAGRTLGGALRSGSGKVANVRVAQTSDAGEAGEGRVCRIRFDIACKSRSTA